MNLIDALRQAARTGDVIPALIATSYDDPRDSEFKVMCDTLRALGVPHSIDHAPCRGNGEIGKDDAIQAAMLEHGHNVTSLCTTGIQIGPLTLVFFTGASDVPDIASGAFMFTLNRETRAIEWQTKGRKVIARTAPGPNAPLAPGFEWTDERWEGHK